MLKADGWFLYPQDKHNPGAAGAFQREEFVLGPCEPDEVIAAPLYGCWEGNMGHALARKPIDICDYRKEAKVIIGNAGVVRVLETGSAVRQFVPGQVAMIFCASKVDPYGFPEKMLAYDAQGTMGCLATRMKLREHELLPLPRGTRFGYAQWAAFSIRYITAWANLEMALGTFRLMVDVERCPTPHVWGWGGGTTLAELDLARRFGCRSVMLSGNDRRLASIDATGVIAVDRRTFGDLAFDERRHELDASYREAYSSATRAFLAEVERHTGPEGVHIFVDYIGSPLLRLTLKAIGRVGVVATAGWKEGMVMSFLRASECIGRRQHIHTHYAARRQALAAIEYAESSGWMPAIDEPPTPFERIPQLAARHAAGDVGFFPVFSVNPE